MSEINNKEVIVNEENTNEENTNEEITNEETTAKTSAESIGSKLMGLNDKIAKGVVAGYKAIENSVVGGYKKIENGAVSGFNKVSDKFVEKLFTKEGESVEEAKARMTRGVKEMYEETDKAGEVKTEDERD